MEATIQKEVLIDQATEAVQEFIKLSKKRYYNETLEEHIFYLFGQWESDDMVRGYPELCFKFTTWLADNPERAKDFHDNLPARDFLKMLSRLASFSVAMQGDMYLAMLDLQYLEQPNSHIKEGAAECILNRYKGKTP